MPPPSNWLVPGSIKTPKRPIRGGGLIQGWSLVQWDLYPLLAGLEPDRPIRGAGTNRGGGSRQMKNKFIIRIK